MIDQATIDRIMDAAQIVDVVSEFVTLRKRGVNYIGLCPFHNEKTPSFSVSPSKGVCKCFSCGKGGNVVHFIMEHEQLSYYEALKWLARKYNIEVKERELTDEERQAQNLRESLFVVNQFACDYFQDILHNSLDGQRIGMTYLRGRGFRDDIIRKFQLGYCTDSRDTFAQTALKKGFKEDFLVKTGLCYRKDDGTLHDRFWGRVIFPVHTLSGKVVAFGGRVLNAATKNVQMKYVNSPESEIYHKSRELYGIHFAKQAIVRQDRCFLVEGYTDVISMHQSGIENVVASSGTALTPDQIRLIHRFTNNITVLYDGDGADNVISSVDDCVELYLWYVDRVLERFEEKNYQNLDFKGFFWSTESLIEDTNDYEVTLAERCVKGLHDRGLQCVFIPYFQSAGSWMAEDIGFDATIMQPNLSFNEWAQKDPENFMKDFTSTAAKYHFGIQLEMKENLASNKEPYASYFRQYLVSAVQSGMMTDAVHAYYQGAGYGSVYQCAVSSDPELRWLYDSLYKFIKGTLSFPGQPQVNCDTEITVEEDSMYTGNISLEGDWYCDFTVASQAPNGTVMCYPGVGEYRYRPDRGFTGSDSFGISVTMPDGSEKIVTVNVTVTPEGTDVSDTSQEASEAESTPDSGKGGILPYIAGGAVILAGAVCAVVAAVLKKKKKNSGDGSKPESK